MKDKHFIQQMVDRSEAAREKLNQHLPGLNFHQLNWKPHSEAWSIGQCLDHLLVSNTTYFPQLKKIRDGKFKMSSWEQWSPLSGLFGKVLVSQVGEIPKKKMQAPKVFLPAESDIDVEIYERFDKHLDSLVEYITWCANTDIDRIKISSPVSKMITYNLRNAFILLTNHLHRHLNQAIRIREDKNFPTN